MRREAWAARLVFALGALVMVATSAPPKWGDTKHLTTALESEGQGDDKLLRMHLRMTDGVAKDAGRVSVRVSGSVDRPASDLTIAWLDEGSALAGAQSPESFGTSEDFQTVYTSIDTWPGCPDDAVCELLFEGLIATKSSVGYAMELAIQIEIAGSREKRPRGEIEASVEVLDAP
jgi:hypothetical protein